MQSVQTYTGELLALIRQESSRNGNPRYLVHIEGVPMAYTQPDSMLAYELPNYVGKRVTVRIGWHYNRLQIDSLDVA